MEPSPLNIALALGALFALTVLLKRLREAREVLSEWTLESTAFKIFSKEQDAKIAKEAEATRNLIRDTRDELLRALDAMKATHCTRIEFERLKGRTTNLETLNEVVHGTRHVAGDSSTYVPGDRLP